MLAIWLPLLPAAVTVAMTVAMFQWTATTPDVPPLSQFEPRLPSARSGALWRSMEATVQEPSEPQATAHPIDDDTIFVSMAQLMDVYCPKTLVELFGQARRPDRVFIGLVDQRYNQSESCLLSSLRQACADKVFCMSDNIRVRWSIPTDGWGPTFGRFMASLMYQGEKYFMMIDSHSRFISHWDMKMIENALLVPPRSVLSHYPTPFNTYRLLISHRQQHGKMAMCAAHFNTEGIIRLDSVHVNTDFAQAPILQPFSAAGFVFGDAAFAQEVPFDPHLYFIFDGEEITYSARLWTHGFDSYTPTEQLLFHHYERHRLKAPRYWDRMSQWSTTRVAQGKARVMFLLRSRLANSTQVWVTRKQLEQLGNAADIDRYGMGTRRSLADFYEFARIDPVHWVTNMSFCLDIRAAMVTPERYRRPRP